jgi:hypothetical protein
MKISEQLFFLTAYYYLDLTKRVCIPECHLWSQGYIHTKR